MDFYITILAGGLGKRMKSKLPKVLHSVKGYPMLVRIIGEARKLNPKKIIIVVGEYKDIIKETLQKYTSLSDIEFAIQEIALGTGDAVKSTIPVFSEKDDAYNMVLNGDTPLLTNDTLGVIKNNFIKNNYRLQITCIKLDNPTGNGRIIKDDNGQFQKIVEEKDCDDEQKKINLVNCGIYMMTTDVLLKYIPMIKNNNAQKEYYLTDIVELYKQNEEDNVGLVELDSSKISEIANVNTKEQLESINKI